MLYPLLKYGALISVMVTQLFMTHVQSELSAPHGSSEAEIHIPSKVSDSTVPAQIAFTSGGSLWILNGGDKNTKPV